MTLLTFSVSSMTSQFNVWAASSWTPACLFWVFRPQLLLHLDVVRLSVALLAQHPRRYTLSQRLAQSASTFSSWKKWPTDLHMVHGHPKSSAMITIRRPVQFLMSSFQGQPKWKIVNNFNWTMFFDFENATFDGAKTLSDPPPISDPKSPAKRAVHRMQWLNT